MVRGRGRLSGIAQLPAEASPIIAWANDELRQTGEGARTQTDIYKEFYLRLEALQKEHRGELDFTIPSFQAFNRHSIKLATLSRRLDETRAITGMLAEKFDAKASDDLTIIAAEAIKTLVFEIITAAGEARIDPKGALNLAGALFKATQAQGVSTIRRAKVEKEFGEKVGEALETVRKATGMSQEVSNQIKAQILGVRT
ncbi:hypothetical protein ASD44_09735 [Mesorhizobium sp. Root554]|uniref:DUF3486 family protein n=1 Tax=unclassified Mesorhizobium TaxID=325217 RepID=UPI0006F1FDD6|nr:MULTISPECIES: DUF3486 family protein [unclassified Mesorhizobium]KQZ14323.1 hypothetical protein ASD27_09745 [Mesorhizobium sp. Root1471]KQZ36834.1 hypothetical protein ASD44_09735 [Mesorhizobium sp. Root554]